MWDDSKISEFYKKDIDYAQIETFIMRWNEIQPEHSGIDISYDSANMNTTAESVNIAEYGHAKEDPKDVYAVTKTGIIGNDLLVRYFHIYYDNVKAGQEKKRIP